MNKKITNLLFVISIAVFLFGSGYKIGQYKANKTSYNIVNSDKKADQSRNIDFDLFWETWEKVEQKYIDQKKVDAKKMFYGAIKGMVASMDDPYTFFLTPEENKQTKDDLQGKFEGIGAQLGLKENRVVVIAPLKGSPSEAAGIKAGDFINKVNGQPTKGWTLPQAVSKIRGDKGTKVTLTLQRNDKEFDTTITRSQIIVESVELTYEKRLSCTTNCQSAAYLKLNQFGENTNDEWDKSIEEIRKKWNNEEIKGMVLDLRDNPGGFLESSVYLGSEFLPSGKLIVKQESTTYENKEYKSNRTGRLTEIPLSVLINKGSASASEILAGTLRDHNRAKLIGEKSFGKGSVQEALDLKDGAGLHITVAKWILPNGDWINSKGIEPQFKIENVITEGNTLNRQTDIQLEKAIEVVLQ